MKVGLLGAGYILDAHATALRAIRGIEITAICDRNRARAQQAADRYGIGRTTGTLEELLSTGVETVHVAGMAVETSVLEAEGRAMNGEFLAKWGSAGSSQR